MAPEMGPTHTHNTGENMKYSQLKAFQEAELNAFPLMFAFTKGQLKRAFEKNGVKDGKAEVYSIGGGGFVKKTDYPALEAMFDQHRKELADAMGDWEFMIDAMEYELANHEFCITYDTSDALEALHLVPGNLSKIQQKCLHIARERYFESNPG